MSAEDERDHEEEKYNRNLIPWEELTYPSQADHCKGCIGCQLQRETNEAVEHKCVTADHEHPDHDQEPSGFVDPTDIDEMVESLYNLDREELRRLAWEALLIADGPDRVKPEEMPKCPNCSGPAGSGIANQGDILCSRCGHVIGKESCFAVEVHSPTEGWSNITAAFVLTGLRGWTT